MLIPCSERSAHDQNDARTGREQLGRTGHGQVAPGARGTEEGMEPDDLLCSRNARPQKALVGRAQ